MTPRPLAKPSRMSTRLKALDIPTNHTMVSRICSHQGMTATCTMMPDLRRTKTATT